MAAKKQAKQATPAAPLTPVELAQQNQERVLATQCRHIAVQLATNMPGVNMTFNSLMHHAGLVEKYLRTGKI